MLVLREESESPGIRRARATTDWLPAVEVNGRERGTCRREGEAATTRPRELESLAEVKDRLAGIMMVNGKEACQQ